MALHRPLLTLIILTLVAALAACTPPTPAATPTPAPSPTATPTVTACTNPLLPVVEGAKWVYTLSGTSSGTLTHSITAVRPDGFSDQDVFDTGLTRTGEWKCEDGALTVLSPAESLSAMFKGDGTTGSYKTTSTTGITLPAIVTPGTAWTQDVTFEGTQTISGQELPVKGTATYACTAGDTETVSLPAGALDAVRVGCQINVTASASILGIQVPTELASVATIWYARGIGMVKTENEVSGMGHTSIELTSYTLP